MAAVDRDAGRRGHSSLSRRGGTRPMSSTIDLQFQGHAGVIATAVIPVGGGVVLVDPGPSVVPPGARARPGGAEPLARRRARPAAHAHPSRSRRGGGHHRPARPGLAGLRPRDRRQASGEPGEAPGERHAPVRRRDGSAVGRVPGRAGRRRCGRWPAASRSTLDGRRFDVAYTPGHAVHHVSYFDAADGTAYVGDTAGIQVSPGYVLPATPPPDIDLERWAGEPRRPSSAWRAAPALSDALRRGGVAGAAPGDVPSGAGAIGRTSAGVAAPRTATTRRGLPPGRRGCAPDVRTPDAGGRGAWRRNQRRRSAAVAGSGALLAEARRASATGHASSCATASRRG